MELLDLTIKNIRGLPNLYLLLDGKSVVIWGPNGAGKSCVVDAIEFLFTGKISRLVGEGTAGITLARHGPHIDQKPEAASVTATIQLDNLSQPVELTRCMARPDELECPDEAKETLANLNGLMSRGGVVLTRRDILRYITAEAGKRANEIQALLHLENIEHVRKGLQRAKNELRAKKKAALEAIETAKADVNVTLSLPEYSDTGLLQAVNESRGVLRAKPVDALKSENLRDGILPLHIQKSGQANANLNHIQKVISKIRRVTELDYRQILKKNDETLRKQIEELKGDTDLIAELEQLELTTQAMRFVDHSTIECPICGASWSEGYLRQLLTSRIANAQAARTVQENIIKASKELGGATGDVRANVEALIDAARVTNLKSHCDALKGLATWRSQLDRMLEALKDPVGLYLHAGLHTTEVSSLLAPENLSKWLDGLDKAAKEELPKPSIEQTAWDTLTKLQVGYSALEKRIQDKEAAQLMSLRADALSRTFEQVRDSVLNDLYSRISTRFVEFYALLHDHERDHFKARLEPNRAALSFDVDFMGRGTHPPHALHSEGHQDSMGVCLFLALNEELSRSNHKLIVLDDVVMSVDTGHRRDVCRLLKDKFSDYQFIITTHDKTWARQLRQEGVIDAKKVIQFAGWTLEHGPRAQHQRDLWEVIQTDLQNEDVPSAAFRLRRGSEEYFESVCDALGADVIYNSGMQWQLDDFLPAAVSQYKTLVKRYRTAAASWGNNKSVEEADELESIRRQVYGRTKAEEWVVNTAVHFNNWENMSKEEFQPVADAFKDLHDLFSCTHCGGLIERAPHKGSPETVRCPCSGVSWNLRVKSK